MARCHYSLLVVLPFLVFNVSVLTLPISPRCPDVTLIPSRQNVARAPSTHPLSRRTVLGKGPAKYQATEEGWEQSSGEGISILNEKDSNQDHPQPVPDKQKEDEITRLVAASLAAREKSQHDKALESAAGKEAYKLLRADRDRIKPPRKARTKTQKLQMIAENAEASAQRKKIKAERAAEKFAAERDRRDRKDLKRKFMAENFPTNRDRRLFLAPERNEAFVKWEKEQQDLLALAKAGASPKHDARPDGRLNKPQTSSEPGSNIENGVRPGRPVEEAQVSSNPGSVASADPPLRDPLATRTQWPNNQFGDFRLHGDDQLWTFDDIPLWDFDDVRLWEHSGHF